MGVTMDPRLSSAASSRLAAEDPMEATTDDPSSEASSSATSDATESEGPNFKGRLEDWFPTSTGDATSALGDVSAFCMSSCPMFHNCPGDTCHVFRVEQRANAWLREGPASKVGVLDKPTIGIT